VNGVSFLHYHSGNVYDLPPALAEYLVLEGFAKLEMRRTDRKPAPEKQNSTR
jgi:hypothetical protein